MYIRLVGFPPSVMPRAARGFLALVTPSTRVAQACVRGLDLCFRGARPRVAPAHALWFGSSAEGPANATPVP